MIDLLLIAPYASTVPYNIIIYPKRHMSCFAEAEDADLSGLAGILQEVLGKLYGLLDNPDYNYVIDTSPSGSIREQALSLASGNNAQAEYQGWL